MQADENPRKTRRPRAKKVSGVLGVGLDNQDGHKRITKGEDFFLFGGSQETHERMTDIVMRMKERMKKDGKSFSELSTREFENLGRDCL